MLPRKLLILAFTFLSSQAYSQTFSPFAGFGMGKPFVEVEDNTNDMIGVSYNGRFSMKVKFGVETEKARFYFDVARYNATSKITFYEEHGSGYREKIRVKGHTTYVTYTLNTDYFYPIEGTEFKLFAGPHIGVLSADHSVPTKDDVYDGEGITAAFVKSTSSLTFGVQSGVTFHINDFSSVELGGRFSYALMASSSAMDNDPVSIQIYELYFGMNFF